MAGVFIALPFLTMTAALGAALLSIAAIALTLCFISFSLGFLERRYTSVSKRCETIRDYWSEKKERLSQQDFVERVRSYELYMLFLLGLMMFLMFLSGMMSIIGLVGKSVGLGPTTLLILLVVLAVGAGVMMVLSPLINQSRQGSSPKKEESVQTIALNLLLLPISCQRAKIGKR